MYDQNNSDVYCDVAEYFSFDTDEQLKEVLIKWDNEASPSISSDGTVTINTIPVTLRKKFLKVRFGATSQQLQEFQLPSVKVMQ